MSDINNIGGSTQGLQSYSSYTDNPVFQSLPSSVQDSLIQSFTKEELNERFANATVSIPSLLAPNDISGSLDNFFKVLSEAKVQLNLQFRTAEFIDQLTRRQDSREAGLQALGLVGEFARREVALQQTKEATEAKMAEIHNLNEAIKNQINDQNNAIDNINNGNSQEKSKYQELINNYNSYIAKLAANGITINGNGTVTIPDGKVNTFNSLTQAYSGQVAGFNAYIGSRKNELNNYNNTANSYNQAATANNEWINNLVKDLGLQDYLDKHQLTVPLQAAAGTRNTAEISQEAAPAAAGAAGVVAIPTPSAYAYSVANGTRSLAIGKVPDYQQLNENEVKPVIEDGYYTQIVKPVDSDIIYNSQYWGFLRVLSIFNPNRDYVPDPLLNFKPLAKKISPNTIVEAMQPIQGNNAQGAGGLTVESAGLDNPHITAILGQAAFAQALRNANLNLTEEQIREYSNNLVLLSSDLIAQSSIDALLPSLAPILSQLETTPQDSPLFSLSFSLSFANRINELTGHGLTEESLKEFLSGIPALQNLSKADIATLTANLNLGLLLTSSKLLESSLGLPGISQQLILSQLPPELSSSIISQASIQSDQLNADLKTQINANFIQQGFAKDQAAFLANLGQEMVKNDILRPSPTTISEDNLNTQLLTDSIKASLILSDSKIYDLAKADAIANEVILRTLSDSEGTIISSTQFKANLESNLRDLNIPSSQIDEILKDVILVSSQNVFTQEHLNLAQLIEQSVSSLVPQGGGQLAKLISAEIANTLFGHFNPDTRDIANLKSPLSLINLVNDQLNKLEIDQNNESAKAVSEAFKATLLTTTDFYAFSLQVMDPAYSLVYSVGTGLMYAGQEPENYRKSIDIIV
ncbi:hypothetical protein [Candidatus Protochlamydia sp. R18]|uniref:hypothetical protein n=1 Tax=Candidatus Protochlamydia sp. R18 TaxID=1353977 RepID=UPI0005A5EFC8|nr:hypothetical protein [Candidatus Protochlamydia sp. R18]